MAIEKNADNIDKIFRRVMKTRGIEKRNNHSLVYNEHFKPGLKTLGYIDFLKKCGVSFLRKNQKSIILE